MLIGRQEFNKADEVEIFELASLAISIYGAMDRKDESASAHFWRELGRRMKKLKPDFYLRVAQGQQELLEQLIARPVFGRPPKEQP